MSNQPQASVHKSATGLPLAAPSAVWTPPALTLSAPQQAGPELLCCVCRPPSASLLLVTSPASTWRDFRTDSRTSASGQMWRLSPSPCVCGVPGETPFPTHTTARTYLVYTIIPFQKLEPSNWDDSAEQKNVLGSSQLKCSSEGKNVDSECCMNMWWETSKELHSQFGLLKERSSPRKGQLFSPSWLLSEPCLNWENW